MLSGRESPNPGRPSGGLEERARVEEKLLRSYYGTLFRKVALEVGRKNADLLFKRRGRRPKPNVRSAGARKKKKRGKNRQDSLTMREILRDPLRVAKKKIEACSDEPPTFEHLTEGSPRINTPEALGYARKEGIKRP